MAGARTKVVHRNGAGDRVPVDGKSSEDTTFLSDRYYKLKLAVKDGAPCKNTPD